MEPSVGEYRISFIDSLTLKAIISYVVQVIQAVELHGAGRNTLLSIGDLY